MIESQEDASATPTVLAAAMLISAWEDINDTRRRSYAGNQSQKLDPEMISTTQGSPPKGNKRSAMDVRSAREKANVKAGNIRGNSSNHDNNASRGVRVAGESPGGVTPRNHPQYLNEGVPPSVERLGGTPNACTHPNPFPMRKWNRTSARNKFKAEQYIHHLPKSQEQNTMGARSRAGGRCTKCDPDGRKTKLYRPATSQQQEVPACTAMAVVAPPANPHGKPPGGGPHGS